MYIERTSQKRKRVRYETLPFVLYLETTSGEEVNLMFQEIRGQYTYTRKGEGTMLAYALPNFQGG